jgi:ABC-type glycerol-3-phosphate transport system substrate-binding protein
MKRFLTIAGFLAVILLAGACGHSGAKTPSTDTSSVMGPAPDNNSANNPSLADTAYEKNRTRPITDTIKKK